MSRDTFKAKGEACHLTKLAVACYDSIKELETAFPFLLEGVEDE